NFVGDLADSIEQPSPTEWLFHLRRGVRFADGRPLTARDVRFSYDSIMDPRLASPARANLSPLLSVDEVDDYTVRLTTRMPYPSLLAIAMAIDRDAIVDSLMRGTGRVASGMLSPENWAYTPDVMTYRYDPDAAKRLLDEAGYRDPDGDGPRMRFTLNYKTTPEGGQFA